MARRQQSAAGRPCNPCWWLGSLLNTAVAESGAPEELRHLYFLFATEFYHSIARRRFGDPDELTMQVVTNVTRSFSSGLSDRLLRFISSATQGALSGAESFANGQ